MRNKPVGPFSDILGKCSGHVWGLGRVSEVFVTCLEGFGEVFGRCLGIVFDVWGIF